MKQWDSKHRSVHHGALTLGTLYFAVLTGCAVDSRDVSVSPSVEGFPPDDDTVVAAPDAGSAGGIAAPGESDLGDTVVVPDGGLLAGLGTSAVGGECSGEATACSGVDRLLACEAGAFVEREVCPFICEVGPAGASCGGSCEPGTRRCAEDGTPQLCDERGELQADAPCGDATPRCVEGECRACAPGETRCNEAGLPETCDPEQLTWAAGAPCASESPLCVPETGVCGQCSPGSTRACVGELGNCAAGTQECGVDSLWGPCSVQPAAADSCMPGDDANCNGQPNEGCDCTQAVACGPEQPQGICRAGTSECINGNPGVCQGAVFPAGRNCASAADNDCDGRPDNTIDNTCQCTPGTGRACEQHPGLDGIGICRAGQQSCIAAAGNLSSTFSGCQGSVPPRARDCRSSLDNDCNGAPDNRIDNACQCVPGEQRDCGIEPGSLGCSRGVETCQLFNGNTQSRFGACVFTDVNDGTACDDGDGQTVGDSCRAGTCGGNRVGTLATGELASCAVRSGGAVYCWGSAPYFPAPNSPPTRISLAIQAVAVNVGNGHACAIANDRSLHCWGANGLGTLGNGTTTDVTTGAARVDLSGVVQVDTNTNNTAALTSDGRVFLWGATIDGPSQRQLFGPTPPTETPFISSPHQIAELGQVSHLGLGMRHACAALGSGQVLCWGRNDFSQLGQPPTSGNDARANAVLVNLDGDDDAISVASGDSFSCALRSGGQVVCWGSIFSGDLDPAEAVNAPPTPVPRLSGAIQLSVGSSSACALRSDGTVACWGGNAFGELGTGSFVGSLSAQTVAGLTDAVLLSTSSALGGRSVCALRRTGAVVCWGANNTGQIGDGTTTNRNQPVQVRSLPD